MDRLGVMRKAGCGAPRIGLVLLAANLAESASAWATFEPLRAVSFPPGAFSSELRGGIPRGDRDCYTIGARTGQRLSVTQTPGPEDNIVFQIYQPPWKMAKSPDGPQVSGSALTGAGDGDDARSWSGRLPVSGTYLLVLGTTRGGGEYRVRVEIR